MGKSDLQFSLPQKSHTCPLFFNAMKRKVISKLPSDISESRATQGLQCSLTKAQRGALTGCCQCIKSEFKVSGCSKGNPRALIVLGISGC